jgi:hypothetical protein
MFSSSPESDIVLLDHNRSLPSPERKGFLHEIESEENGAFYLRHKTSN